MVVVSKTRLVIRKIYIAISSSFKSRKWDFSVICATPAYTEVQNTLPDDGDYNDNEVVTTAVMMTRYPRNVSGKKKSKWKQVVQEKDHYGQWSLVDYNKELIIAGRWGWDTITGDLGGWSPAQILCSLQSKTKHTKRIVDKYLCV